MSESISLPDRGIRQMFFSTGGRLNRLRYFKRQLVLGLSAGLFLGVAGLLLPAPLGRVAEQGVPLFVCWPAYCLAVRRLHDMGREEGLAKAMIGCNLLAILAGIFFDMEHVMLTGPSDPATSGIFYGYGALSLLTLALGLFLLFKRGERGRNQYGADPLEL